MVYLQLVKQSAWYSAVRLLLRLNWYSWGFWAVKWNSEFTLACLQGGQKCPMHIVLVHHPNFQSWIKRQQVEFHTVCRMYCNMSSQLHVSGVSKTTRNVGLVLLRNDMVWTNVLEGNLRLECKSLIHFRVPSRVYSCFSQVFLRYCATAYSDLLKIYIFQKVQVQIIFFYPPFFPTLY